jgi:hypothetical protein
MVYTLSNAAAIRRDEMLTAFRSVIAAELDRLRLQSDLRRFHTFLGTAGGCVRTIHHSPSCSPRHDPWQRSLRRSAYQQLRNG